MTLILSGTDGLSDVDGSAATPAIRGTDANTGIFFPAADTIAFAEGGAEAMRIDSSGNVGIGTSSPGSRLDVATGTTNRLRVSESGSNLFFDSLNNAASAWEAKSERATQFRWLTAASGEPSTGVTLDSSGNLGLGVTPSAWGSAYKALQLGNLGTAGITIAGNDASIGTNYYVNSSNNITYATTGAISYLSVFDGKFRFYIAPSGTVNTTATLTQAMTLDASGSLLVGYTSSGGVRGVFSNGANGLPATSGTTQTYGALRVRGGDNAVIDFGCSSTNTWIQATDLSGLGNGYNLLLNPNGGNVLVGTTSASFSGATRQFVVNNSGGYAAGFGNTTAGQETVVIQNGDTSGTRRLVVFKAGTAGVGEISSNGTTTTYATSSDYRLKENVAPMTGALAKVLELNPVTYTWKSDGSDGQGFIAHELQEVYPDAVSGEKDGEQMQGVDYGKLTPILTAALQEAIAKIETLEARIAALEAK